MRLFWPLIAGAGLLAIAALSATIALHSGGNPGTAEAITPTPNKEDRAWRGHLLAPDQVTVGDLVTVSAGVSIRQEDVYPPGVVGQARYRLQIRTIDPMLESLSSRDVTVDDILDGVEWELLAVRSGEASVTVRVSVELTWCDECAPRSNPVFVLGRSIDVKALPGDVNCDVQANSIDAALILQFAAALVGELPCQDVADVSQDGSVNAVDATLILQFAAGLLDTLTRDF